MTSFLGTWLIHFGIEMIGSASYVCATGRCNNPLHLHHQVRQALQTGQGRKCAAWLMAISIGTSGLLTFTGV
jgi:hypothetical protein